MTTRKKRTTKLPFSTVVPYPSMCHKGTMLITYGVVGVEAEHRADAVLVINENQIACVKDRYGVVTQHLAAQRTIVVDPVEMLLHCPICNERHIDKGYFAGHPHHTHACQHCGHVWRPAKINTIGVQFLPGFKDS